MLSSNITTSCPDSTKRFPLSSANSATRQWSSTGSSNVELNTSPWTDLLTSVTSSGLSPIRATIRLTSGAFADIPCAICFSRVVLPALGGATIKPRCPLPTGESKSIKRVDRLSCSVSNFNCTSGKTGVRASKLGRSLEIPGSIPFTPWTLTNP